MPSSVVVGDGSAGRAGGALAGQGQQQALLGVEQGSGEAGDGQEALERCAAAMPDFILLDWNMPVMNGIDFLKTLRATPGGDSPIVVFCTTENDIEHIQAALEAGASEYIMKPFDREILEAKLVSVGAL